MRHFVTHDHTLYTFDEVMILVFDNIVNAQMCSAAIVHWCMLRLWVYTICRLFICNWRGSCLVYFVCFLFYFTYFRNKIHTHTIHIILLCKRLLLPDGWTYPHNLNFKSVLMCSNRWKHRDMRLQNWWKCYLYIYTYFTK